MESRRISNCKHQIDMLKVERGGWWNNRTAISWWPPLTRNTLEKEIKKQISWILHGSFQNTLSLICTLCIEKTMDGACARFDNMKMTSRWSHSSHFQLARMCWKDGRGGACDGHEGVPRRAYPGSGSRTAFRLPSPLEPARYYGLLHRSCAYCYQSQGNRLCRSSWLSDNLRSSLSSCLFAHMRDLRWIHGVVHWSWSTGQKGWLTPL